MKFCQTHWDALRKAVADAGMGHLVAENGAAVVRRLESELKEQDGPDDYDPLMGCFWAISNNALACGGLYLMTGDYCPICEKERHIPGGEDWIALAVGDAHKRCVESSLLPKVR